MKSPLLLPLTKDIVSLYRESRILLLSGGRYPILNPFSDCCTSLMMIQDTRKLNNMRKLKTLFVFIKVILIMSLKVNSVQIMPVYHATQYKKSDKQGCKFHSVTTVNSVHIFTYCSRITYHLLTT